MEKQIREIISFHCGGMHEAKTKAVKEILALFDVIDRRELLEKYSKFLDENEKWMNRKSFKDNINDFLQ